MLDSIAILEFWLGSAFRMTTPILLASLGGLLSLQIGIANIGLEGFILIGSFFAVLISYITANAFLGVMAAGLLGLIAALIFGLCVIKLDGDPVIVGLAINLIASGSTIYLLRVLLRETGAFRHPGIIPIPKFSIPILSNIPIIGKMFLNQSALMYISIVLLILIYILIYKTPWGLFIRSVGENPDAAKTVGINVVLVKYLCLMGAGFLCGIAGSELSLGFMRIFSEDMVQGRGFLAFSATIIGNANPLMVAAASLIFGAAESIAVQAQSLEIPAQFPLMAPYIITILTMVFFSRNFKLLIKRLANKLFYTKKE